MLEIEVKFRVDDPKAFREKLLRAGAALTKERYREENILYDFRTHDLERKSQALRLRVIGKKTFLTFKGAPQNSRSFKIREEYETEIKNEKAFRRILKKLDFIPAFRYTKHRTVFRKGKLKICLDETPIGCFCELEGERPDIVRFARSLGVSRKDFIKLDYVQLLKMAGYSSSDSFSGGSDSSSSSAASSS